MTHRKYIIRPCPPTPSIRLKELEPRALAHGPQPPEPQPMRPQPRELQFRYLLPNDISLYESLGIAFYGALFILFNFRRANTANYSGIFSYKPGANLNEFHVYTMVREEHWLSWYFDGHMFYKLNMENLSPTIASELKDHMTLNINLIVGGPKLDKKWKEVDIATWKCPSLIVDYVRVYGDERYYKKLKNADLKKSNFTPAEICSTVKSLSMITLSTSTGLYYTLSYILVAFLIIMFIVLGILFWKLKKRFDNNINSNEQDEIGTQKEIDRGNENYDYILYGDLNAYENIRDANEEGYLKIYDRISINTIKITN